MIPSVDREAVLKAMDRFDRELRHADEWVGWEQNQAHKYAIDHDGQRYPVKQAVSLATGIPVSDFSGGEGAGQANQLVRGLGFDVVALRQDQQGTQPSPHTPPASEGAKSIRSHIEEFLVRFPEIRSSKPYRVDQELRRIVESICSALERAHALRSRPTLKVKWSVGTGEWAKIPWIAILDSRETNSTQRGIYCVFLFRQDMSGVYLTFNQGVAELKKQHGGAAGLQLLRERAESLLKDLHDLSIRGFALDDQVDLRTEAGLGRAYEVSTIAYKLYERGGVPPDVEIEADLDALLSAYDRYLAGKMASNTATPGGTDEVSGLDRQAQPAYTIDKKRLDAAIQLFVWIYGEEGFASQRYLAEERQYKIALSEEWRSMATPEGFKAALANGAPEAFATDLGKLLTDPKRSNLLPWRYGDVLKRFSDRSRAETFLRVTHDLLFGSKRDAPAVDEFNASMAPHYTEALNATSVKPASHVLPSLMLWLSEPDQQFFLRPELYNRSVRCLTGSLPKGQGNVMKTAYYQAAVEFARELLHVLAPLGPQDMIDIQGFIWAVFSHSRLWFGGKTYGGTKDMLPEFLRRQVYAVHFAPRPPVAELLKGITSLDKAGREERRAAIERQLTTDKEKKALLGFFDLACAPNSLLLAKSVWYNRTSKLSLMRISGVCRTGNTVTFDEELGHQLSVTWLTTPDRVLTLGEHFPQVSHTLTSLPIEKALDILALEEPTDLRETGSARQQLPLTSLEEEDEEQVPEPPPPPLQPVYTVEDFRRETRFPAPETERWLGRLRRKMQVILQGPPGTGKTFLAERLARIIVSGARGFWDIVQFHPSYGYEDFMQGIRPRVISGQLTYELEPGRFLHFCEKARAAPDGAPCVLIIDEVNRADLSRVFGELMYLLEYRDQEIPLASGGARFRIPRNVYLIGTMNTADRSIALVDHALRRRFSFIHVGPNYEILQEHLTDHGLPATGLVQALRDLNALIGDPNYEIGISFFIKDGSQLEAVLEDIWRGEIEPYLEEYFYDQLGKVEAFRWDSVARKQLSDWPR